MAADVYDMRGECRFGLSYYGIGRRLSSGAVFGYLKRVVVRLQCGIYSFA